MNVAVLGASNDPEKYSYKAVKLLKENGHTVFPVHPKNDEIDGIKVYKTLGSIAEPLDTISLYVSKDISSKVGDEILQKNPRRIIFNPGAENPDLQAKASKKGVQALEACTLVLLKTHQF